MFIARGRLALKSRGARLKSSAMSAASTATATIGPTKHSYCEDDLPKLRGWALLCRSAREGHDRADQNPECSPLPPPHVPCSSLAAEELAAAYRICAAHGYNEGVCNHLTVALQCSTASQGSASLVIPHGLDWSEVTAGSFVLWARRAIWCDACCEKLYSLPSVAAMLCVRRSNFSPFPAPPPLPPGQTGW